MKTQPFQSLLLRTAVVCMGVDGEIHQSEITVLKKVIKQSAYFLDFAYEDELQGYIDRLKKEGKGEIENYLSFLCSCDLEAKQKIILFEVLLKIVDADEHVHQNELYLLDQIRNAIRVDETELLLHFPRHLNYLLDFEARSQELNLSFISDSNIS